MDDLRTMIARAICKADEWSDVDFFLSEYIAKADAVIAVLPNKAGWQPIETAPKDGTTILLRGKAGRLADGRYGQPDGDMNPRGWVWPYGNAEPTHWMPLPEAPK